jgi:TetR/AcrR family transcriptional repressor of bet genes
MTNILDTQMGRPSNTLERREQIVDGLLTVMSSHGYEGASIVAIGRAAGLTPGLVHYHFDTKAEVLLALVERLIAQVRARYQALGGDRLDAFIDAHLALGPGADPRAAAAWSIIGAEALRQPDVRRLYRHALASSLKELRRLVGERLRSEHRSTRNAGRVAAALISAIEGAFRIAAAAPGALPAGYAAPMVRRMAHGLVSAEPRS